MSWSARCKAGTDGSRSCSVTSTGPRTRSTTCSGKDRRVCGARWSGGQRGAVHLELATLIVHDHDEAIAFFVDKLQFDLVEDSPARTNDGRPKRWVVVRPPGASTGLLLAQADGDEQLAVVGRQHAGRVGFFLRVDDFDAAYQRMRASGVEFLSEPRDEPYGRFAVFRDVAGNRWDLLGPRAAPSE